MNWSYGAVIASQGGPQHAHDIRDKRVFVNCKLFSKGCCCCHSSCAQEFFQLQGSPVLGQKGTSLAVVRVPLHLLMQARASPPPASLASGEGLGNGLAAESGKSGGRSLQSLRPEQGHRSREYCLKVDACWSSVGSSVGPSVGLGQVSSSPCPWVGPSR